MQSTKKAIHRKINQPSRYSSALDLDTDIQHLIVALQRSVEKWRLILDDCGKDRGADDCALCQIFNIRQSVFSNEECVGCPVFIATDKKFCEKTPYAEWVEHQRITHKSPLREFRKIECDECRKIAEREKSFLNGLLEMFVRGIGVGRDTQTANNKQKQTTITKITVSPGDVVLCVTGRRYVIRSKARFKTSNKDLIPVVFIGDSSKESATEIHPDAILRKIGIECEGAGVKFVYVEE